MESSPFVCASCGQPFQPGVDGPLDCPQCGFQHSLPLADTPNGPARLPELLREMQRQIAILEVQLNEARRSLEASKNRASDRRLKVAEQQKEIQRLLGEKEQLTRALREAAAAPAPSAAPGAVAAAAAMEPLVRQLEAAEARQRQLVADRDAALGNVEQLQARIVALENECSRLAAGSGEADAAELLALREENEEVRSQLVAVKLELVTLREAQVVAQQAVTQRDGEMEERVARVAKLEKQLATAESEQDRLFDQYQEVQDQLRQLRKQQETVRREKEAAASDLAAATAEIQRLQQALKESETARQEAGEKLAALAAEQAAANEEKQRRTANPFRLLGRRSNS